MARKPSETTDNAAEQEQSMNDAASDAAENSDLITEYAEDVGSQEAPVPLPARDYTAEIRKVEKLLAKSSNSQYYGVHLFVPPEEYPHDFVDGEPDGTTLIYRRLQVKDTPSGRFNMRRWYEALGLPAPGKRINPMDWYGKKVKLTVAHETYEGEARARADRVSRL